LDLPISRGTNDLARGNPADGKHSGMNTSLPDFDLCASLLAVLAEPCRLQIVTRLSHAPCIVSQLADEMGCSIVRVSHHLKILRMANLVRSVKRGKFVTYSLPPDLVKDGVFDLGCFCLSVPTFASTQLQDGS
jgi:DNA-binding transcriptional ArsR family regulator